MAYYDPFQIPQKTLQNYGIAPRAQTPQQPQIDPNQFRQIVVTLNDNSLNQLVQLARQRGISDSDIQAGLKFIRSL